MIKFLRDCASEVRDSGKQTADATADATAESKHLSTFQSLFVLVDGKNSLRPLSLTIQSMALLAIVTIPVTIFTR